MKTCTSDLRRASGLGGGMLMMLSAVVIFAFTGCERPLQPGETYHKLAVAWPIFDAETTEGVEDGVQWKTEKGDAAFWLATWNKHHKYQNNTEIYRKERKTFIPFYSVNVEESNEFKKTWGIILLFPYDSYRTKDATVQVPPLRHREK